MRRKIELEYIFSSSVKVLFSRLSTPAGLSEWFADDVFQKGNQFIFIWNGSEQPATLVKLALEAVMSNSTIPYLDGLKEYMELGYVPMNKSGNSASVTLEYGYDDWTIYNMARLMGKQEVADKYLKRAAAYKYLVDEDLGFIRPKDSVGKWKANFVYYVPIY